MKNRNGVSPREFEFVCAESAGVVRMNYARVGTCTRFSDYTQEPKGDVSNDKLKIKPIRE